MQPANGFRPPAKRIAIIAGGLLVAAVVGLLAAPWLVDVNRFRGRIETLLAERLDRQVTLGRMTLSLVPPGLRVESASVGEDPSFPTGRPFARIGQFYISPRLLPLVAGRFELRALELREPEIELVRGRDGRWNVASLGGRKASPSTRADAPVLSRLVITGGRVALSTLASSGQGDLEPPGASDGRTVYERIDVRVDDFGPDRAFDVTLSAAMPGSDAGTLTVTGTAGPIVRDSPTATPFEGTVRIEQASLAGLLQSLDLRALDGADAVLSGSGDIESTEGLLSSKAALRLDGTRVRGVALDYPIDTDLDLTHDLERGVLTIGSGTLRLGAASIHATGTIDGGADTPMIDLRVRADEAPLAEAARLASAFGVAFGAGTDVRGSASADVRARGPAPVPALEGSVRLRDVDISGGGVAQPVRTPSIDLSLTPDAIRSNEFSVTTAGASVGVRVGLTRYMTPRPSVDTSIRAADVDLGAALSAARAWGAVADGVTGTGRVTLNVQATGPFDALALTGGGSLADATLGAPSIADPVRIARATLTFARDAAVLDSLQAGIGTTSLTGRLAIRAFSAPKVDFEISADRIDVPEMQRLLSPAAAPPRAGAREPARQPGALARVTGSGRLRVGSVAYQNLRFENVQTTVTLDHGQVRMHPLTADLFGGRHRGSVDMDTRRTPAAFTVASSLEKVDANRLLSAVTSLENIVFGSLNATARLTFAGDGAEDLARSMNGALSLDLADGRIANLNLRDEIVNAARVLAGRQAAERTTRVAKLTGDFDVTGGVARTGNLTASIDDATLTADGTIGLADQAVNLRLLAVLSREVSQRAGASRVGSLLNTALANDRGEIVVPVVLRGTMTSPRVSADAERAAEMQLKGLTVRDVVGAVTGRPPAAPQSEASPQESPPAPQSDAGKPEEKPAEKTAVERVQDAVRDLLRRRTPEEQKPADPAAPAPK